MITIKTFEFNAFQENSYVLHDETKECLFVDPGCSDDPEREEMRSYIRENGLKPVAMVNTHCHVDHILGCRFIKDLYNIPFYFNKDDELLLIRAKEQGVFFGLTLEEPPKADFFLEDGQKILFGKSTLDIFYVPGHSAGSVALYSSSDSFVITGDALFKGSIGRTDLPGGNYQQLITSIRSKLLVLPRNVLVFPGHGPHTTIGDEYDTNPFLIN